jgi:hypothetical protein
MNSAVERPKRGLAPTDALARWSDQPLYKELLELSGGSTLLTHARVYEAMPDPEPRKAYQVKLSALEAALLRKLQEGDIFASAIEVGADQRTPIHPTLWEIMEIDYEYEEVISEDRKFRKLELFERGAVPQNIWKVPDWLEAELGAAGESEFRHDDDYRIVYLHGIKFSFGELQGKVLKHLHEAVLDGEPWQDGKVVLELAGSTQMRMGDLFGKKKDWKALIESDGRRWRLRVDRFGNELRD